MAGGFIKEVLEKEDATFDASLRPTVFRDFVGQEKLKERLHLLIEAARQRKEPLNHLLFVGPPGLGKTTLSFILGKAMDADVKTTSGPALQKAGDLASLLTNLQEGNILFIDEIHRIPKSVEEYLYSAMEDYRIDIMIDQGPNARSVRLNLPKFTLVGATTRVGLLSAPFRSRFGLPLRLDYYPAEEICKIVLRSARVLNVDIDSEGGFEIARRSRGTPRVANVLLKEIRDHAQLKNNNLIDGPCAKKALRDLDIDEDGLEEMDKRILDALIQKFGGGPVGIGSLAVAVGEEPDNLEEAYEPFLIQQGYLHRTPQGRTATERAYQKFGLVQPPRAQPTLL
jgi:Holliday junction DNA helicase RuvB